MAKANVQGSSLLENAAWLMRRLEMKEIGTHTPRRNAPVEYY